MSEAELQVLVEVKTGRRMGGVPGTKGDVTFPEAVQGWSDVLDCRHGRYLGMSLDEIRKIADEVHKPFVLVLARQL